MERIRKREVSLEEFENDLECYVDGYVWHCDADFQKCCHTWCCHIDDDTHYVWLLILIPVVIILIIILYKICRFLKRPSTNVPDNNTTLTMDLNQEQMQRGENSNHPVTPPPAYNIAILTPSAPPLHVDNRVPSYEELTARGKT